MVRAAAYALRYMQRILVLNPKGGSGKTTIATNLASYFASQGDHPLLSDNDPQGSSTRWLKKRKPEQAFIHGIAAFERNSRITRAWQLRIPPDAAHVVVDTPAAVMAQDMPDMTKNADAIIVPVLPSDIDIHACSRCIADLLLIAKVRRDENRIGGDRQSRQTQHADLSVADAISGDAAHSGDRDFARLAELRARRRAGGGPARDEEAPRWRRISRTGRRCSRG